MMDRPLLVSGVLRHAERIHGGQEVVCRRGPELTTVTFAELARRARLLGSALTARGVRSGQRVGTLAPNTIAHLEILFAVTGIGAVFHPIDLRLGAAQIRRVIRHADDVLVLFDPALADLIEAVRPALPADRWVAIGPPERRPGSCPNFGDPLGPGDLDFDWPDFDERFAAGLWYTPGTTGRPRGVLSSHRSMVLHSLATLGPNAFPVSAADTVFSAAPVSEVCGWGFPLATLLAGARLLLDAGGPGSGDLVDYLTGERATVGVGVPALWQDVLDQLRHEGGRLPALQRVFCGGAPVPAGLIEALRAELGIEVTAGWGMTETGPIATAGRKPLFGVDARIVDDAGEDLPWDGVTNGHLLVRGPWVASTYFGEPPDPRRPDWFATGDIARIDPGGSVTIADRHGDVIKSGGEWIISLELEAAALGHPDLRQAAAIAVPDEHWGERPVLVATTWRQPPPAAEEVIAHMTERIPRWWLPDHIVFVDELPAGPTGKVVKRRLREWYSGRITCASPLHTSTRGIDGYSLGACSPESG